MPSCDVVVVEDDDDLRAVLVWALERDGLKVLAMSDAGAAISAVRRLRPAVVVLDLVLDGQDSGELVRLLHDGHTPVILVSGTKDVRRHAARLGAASSLHKPFALRDLLDTVRPWCAPGSLAATS